MLDDVESVRCSACGKSARGRPQRCPDCADGGRLRFVYDLDRLRARFEPASWSRREPWLWRYREVLPFDEDFEPPPLQVGFTPLYGSPRLAACAGVRGLLVKDETRQVGASVFDRAAALLVGGATKRRAASGPLAPFAAPYAASCETELVALCSTEEAARASYEYGAEVIRIAVDPGQALAKAQQAGLYLADWPNPLAFEGLKTLGLELGEQLAERLPDWIIVDGQVPDLAEAVREGLRVCAELGVFRRAPQVLELTEPLEAAACADAAARMSLSLGLPVTDGRALAGLQKAVEQGQVEREAVALILASGAPPRAGTKVWPGSESVQSFDALQARLGSR